MLDSLLLFARRSLEILKGNGCLRAFSGSGRFSLDSLFPHSTELLQLNLVNCFENIILLF